LSLPARTEAAAANAATIAIVALMAILDLVIGFLPAGAAPAP
jgi:hypothetical protein